MTKKELVKELSDNTGYPKMVIQDVLESLMETIAIELAEGNQVQLTGFGTFKMKESSARKGRDFSSGESVDIPARTVPVFVPGEWLNRNTGR